MESHSLTLDEACAFLKISIGDSNERYTHADHRCVRGNRLQEANHLRMDARRKIPAPGKDRSKRKMAFQ
ncbi:Uncharacterised protein [Enterobacter hormaechei]|nr:Uncharacterised protein [Enterobacter hormaechei]